MVDVLVLAGVNAVMFFAGYLLGARRRRAPVQVVLVPRSPAPPPAEFPGPGKPTMDLLEP